MKECVIWGAGYCGRIAFDVYGEETVLAFADTYKNGGDFCGRKIISYNSMLSMVRNRQDICVVVASEDYFEEMVRRLDEDGIKDYCVFLTKYIHYILETKKNGGDIFDFPYPENRIRHPELDRFHNKYKGEKIFLVGNGPSLTVEDLDLLNKKNAISFGFNKIYSIFDKTKWRPTYYGIADYYSLQTNRSFIEKTNCECFVWDIVQEFDSVHQFESINYFTYLRETFYPGLPKFSDDITNGVYLGNSVIYDIGMQFAAYMGAKEIILLGVDHKYTNNPTDRKNHFGGYFEETEQNQFFPPYSIDRVNKSYERALLHSRENNYEIINATKGGELNMFKKVELSECFN